MKTNMGAMRLYILGLLFLVTVKMAASQPTFGSKMWCDFFCDDSDDDDDSDSSGDFLDYLFDPCIGCSDSKPSKPKSTTSKPTGSDTVEPFRVMIPPANGLNLTVSNSGGSWLMNLVPWGGQQATPSPGSATTATPAPAAAAAGTTGTAGTTAATTTKKA